MRTVADLRSGDLVETQEGFHLIIHIEESENSTFKVFVLSLGGCNSGLEHFRWGRTLPLDHDLVNSPFYTLRFYRNGERFK